MEKHQGKLILGGLKLFMMILLWSTETVNCDIKASESSLNLPCKPYRVEISFPRIDDATGNGTSRIFSQSSPRNYLRLKIKWRRRPLDIILYKNEVAGQYSISEWEDGNTTYARNIDKSCFFHGYIKGQAKSYVALSTCDGVSGYLQTNQELLFVEPRDVVERRGSSHHAHIVYTCEPPSGESNDDRRKRRAITWPVNYRRRRAAGVSATKYLEVQVVIDHTMVDFIGSKEKTEKYVMDLMNIANTVFQHRSLDIDIKVIVVKMIFLTRNQQKYVLQRKDAYRTVNMFCQWSMDNVPRGQSMDYDISVLITRDELGPSGYAPITGLCNPTRSCAAVHDDGFTTGFVIAHEMAHVFGLFHDGNGNNCYGDKFKTSIMAAVVESKLNHFWWSDCSKRRMKDIIRFLYCLNNKPKAIENHYPLDAPQRIQSDLGKPWSLDFQCALEFGEHFQLCLAMYNDPCNVLWCSRKNNPHYCRTKRGPPMPGTSCGRDKECHNDRCQYVGDRDAIDGHWTEWSQWSECSNGCGVGVKQRSRSCDNPTPMFDGKDCEGPLRIWGACYNTTCTSFQDNREGECDVWDSVQVRYGTHKWMPYEPVNASTKCQQTCKSFYTGEVVTIEVNVADGTPCSYLEDTSDVCMAGKCLSVGCDGIRNSTKKRDECGICDGDGSECKTVQGIVNIKPKSAAKYLPILILPPSARNITVIQLHRTFQSIALKDIAYGKFLLNGDKKHSKPGIMIKKGALIEYSKYNKTKLDKIRIPGPLKAKIAVMVLPNHKLQNISISYSYTVHESDFTFEKNSYKWKFAKWSPCSVTCGSGTQTIMYQCQNKLTDKKAEDEKCTFLERPRSDKVACKRAQCSLERYNYAMSNNFTECNAKCGKSGSQTQMFTCERIRINVYDRVDLKFCSHLRKPNIKRSCMGEPCQNEEQITYKWTVSKEWSQCQSMKECGGPGHRTRQVQCVAIRGQRKTSNETVDEAKCDTETKPESTQMCLSDPCPDKYRWKAHDSWSKCPCGGKNGIQTRKVICERVQESAEIIVTPTEVKDCHNVPDKPDSERSCDGGPCPPRFHWITDGTFSACDAACGETGVQHPTLSCQQVVEWKGTEIVEIVPDSNCNENLKPTEKRCQGPPCKPVFHWITDGTFSACDAPCGETGVRRPTLSCQQVVKREGTEIVEIVPDSNCNENLRPKDKQCQGPPCKLEYRWTSTDRWTECDAKCDETATQHRVFICEKSFNNSKFTQVEDRFCGNVTRQNDTKTCKGPLCALKWQKEPWSECSVTCGRGKRYRTVYCGDPDTDSDDMRCTDRPPQTSRRCDLSLCPAPKRTECRNVFSFCTSYTSLKTRCKRASFKRKCCRTCREHLRKDYIRPPKNALEEYMKRNGLGRWRKRTRR